MDVKCTATMTPTGARSLTTVTSRPVSRQRGLTIESAEDVREQQIRAQDAALAIREWSELALAARRAQNITPPDQVHGFVDRIMAGIPAWVMLDVDKPSRRTIEEYVSNIRDFLVYLALNDLSPAEVGPEDVKAFKMFLQSNGAVDEMERLRALWCGRAQRTLYRLDPRDVVMWLLTLATAKARPNQGQGDRLKALLAVVGSFEIRPRAAYREIYSQDTVALKMTILRVFFNSAIARGALFANPASAVEVSRSKTSRETRIRSRMFSWDEIQALIASCDDALVNQPMDKVRACRDKCIVACGAVLGLRISEVVNLDVTDYDPTNGESGVLLLRAAKGGKDRVVDLTDKMRSVLDKWLNYRRLIKPASPAMFISLHHGSRPDVRQPHESDGCAGCADDV